MGADENEDDDDEVDGEEGPNDKTVANLSERFDESIGIIPPNVKESSGV